MHLVFCGTPQFAVPTLEMLVRAGHDVRTVVTQPDRPRGRGLEVAHSPVKEAALRLGFPILQPAQVRNNPGFRAQMESIAPEAIIVVGYGRIIPQWMLDLPRYGNLNLHASLLPKYRGAAPIQWAIANGETTTGVTTMKIDAGLDTGNILLQRELPIAFEDTAETLSPKLAAIGAELMVQTLREIESGEARPTPQDPAKATLAPILKKEDGRIDFTCPAATLYNRLRGFQPWPGAYTSFRGRQFQIHCARPGTEQGQLGPGELSTDGKRLFAACGSGTLLELIEVQPEGKRRISARDFLNGFRPAPGEKLGP